VTRKDLETKRQNMFKPSKYNQPMCSPLQLSTVVMGSLLAIFITLMILRDLSPIVKGIYSIFFL